MIHTERCNASFCCRILCSAGYFFKSRIRNGYRLVFTLYIFTNIRVICMIAPVIQMINSRFTHVTFVPYTYSKAIISTDNNLCDGIVMVNGKLNGINIRINITEISIESNFVPPYNTSFLTWIVKNTYIVKNSMVTKHVINGPSVTSILFPLFDLFSPLCNHFFHLVKHLLVFLLVDETNHEHRY